MADPERDALAETLARIRELVRQRQGDSATLSRIAGHPRARLEDLQRRRVILEPTPAAPRTAAERVVAWTRRTVYRYFSRWHVRAILAQQNAFNETASELIAALAERAQRAEVDIQRLREELRSALAGARSGTERDGSPGRE